MALTEDVRQLGDRALDMIIVMICTPEVSLEQAVWNGIWSSIDTLKFVSTYRFPVVYRGENISVFETGLIPEGNASSVSLHFCFCFDTSDVEIIKSEAKDLGLSFLTFDGALVRYIRIWRPNQLAVAVESGELKFICSPLRGAGIVVHVKLDLLTFDQVLKVEEDVLDRRGFSAIRTRHDVVVKLNLTLSAFRIAVTDPVGFACAHTFCPQVKI